MEEVLIYEVYVRLDQDGDSIAELYKICFAETGVDEEGKHLILAMEAVDEAPYAEVVFERGRTVRAIPSLKADGHSGIRRRSSVRCLTASIGRTISSQRLTRLK